MQVSKINTCCCGRQLHWNPADHYWTGMDYKDGFRHDLMSASQPKLNATVATQGGAIYDLDTSTGIYFENLPLVEP